ncbi:MAG: isochorismatase family protein, partial [Saprospiraceae bacterium]|nr:isochorismatase family protein [Saprospiraceae bacterium]
MAQPLQVEKRLRVQQSDSVVAEVQYRSESWAPDRTALIVCDMWNKHWCPQATERVGEIAPYMNEVIKLARAEGVLIIHAPSDVTDFYDAHPARNRAKAAPKSQQLPPEIRSWCDWLDDAEKKAYPIDQSDGGCECEDCPSYTAWTRQAEAIEIDDDDAISDDGAEIWNLMEMHGIDHVMLIGVHTNMCVLGRPFGLRNMARYG